MKNVDDSATTELQDAPGVGEGEGDQDLQEILEEIEGQEGESGDDPDIDDDADDFGDVDPGSDVPDASAEDDDLCEELMELLEGGGDPQDPEA